MTENNKKNILNYITNSIEQGTPTTDEIFKEISEIERERWEDFLPNNYKNLCVEGIIEANETTSNLTIIYGGYYKDDVNNAKGFIILLDTNYIPIKSFYSFDNGTQLRYIQKLEQSEDNTFFGIDDTYFVDDYRTKAIGSLPNKTTRFIMLNNFSVLDDNTNDYKLSLRKSYIFEDNNFYCLDISKSNVSSSYAMGGVALTQSGSAGYYFPYNSKIITLQVNVGSSNDWTTETFANYRYVGSNFVFGDDAIGYNFVYALITNSSTALYLKHKSLSNTENTVLVNNFLYPSYFDLRMRNQLCFLDNDTVYFIGNNQFLTFSQPRNIHLGLYKYTISSSELKIIYEKDYGQSDRVWDSSIYITKNQSNIYIQFNDNYTSTGELYNLEDYYIQRLVNDEWNPILIGSQKEFRYNERIMFVTNNYNLLKIALMPITCNLQGWYLPLIKENYNPLNYNGEPYTDYNSVLPQQAEVYHNNSIVFARNLYNKTINENQTNSTVVMPNTYLNNIDLVPQILLSQTNSQMVINNNPINKNIYETLYMNFINTINVINEDTGAIYPRTASYINQNINVGTQNNCESSNVGKVRINANNGSAIETITWNDIDDTHKQTEFALQVNNTINSIELISNDELTTYVTIDTSELETGKTYNISQKLRIE